MDAGSKPDARLPPLSGSSLTNYHDRRQDKKKIAMHCISCSLAPLISDQKTVEREESCAFNGKSLFLR